MVRPGVACAEKVNGINALWVSTQRLNKAEYSTMAVAAPATGVLNVQVKCMPQ